MLGLTMPRRSWDVTDFIGYYAVAFVVYKALELGPYEAAVLLGRTVRLFVAAAQGHM